MTLSLGRRGLGVPRVLDERRGHRLDAGGDVRSAAALAPSRARSAVSALRARAAAAERPRVPLCEA